MQFTRTRFVFLLMLWSLLALPAMVLAQAQTAKAPDRKDADKPATEEASRPKSEEKEFDADEVAALLTKEKPSGGGAKRTQQEASLGGPAVADRGPTIAHPVPIRFAVERVDEPTDLRFVLAVLMKVRGSGQHAGQEQRTVDAGQTAAISFEWFTLRAR